MNDVTVWLLITLDLFNKITENPIIMIGRVLTLGKGVVLVQVVVKLSDVPSEKPGSKNGVQWYQPNLPGMK